MKKLSIFLLCVMLLFVSIPKMTAAEDSNSKAEYENKDEVVYVNLFPNGKTESMYVVNGFQVTKPGLIIDYGNYSDIKNLTSLEKIEQNNNQVQFEANEGEFYYQGTLENRNLPWNIDINYKWNGKTIDPAEIVGEAGQLTIHINVEQEEEGTFNEYYLLQISITTDPKHIHMLEPDEGTLASVGEKEQVVFTVMPGQSETFTVKAEATTFELAPIEINALPANMAVEAPNTEEMTDDMTTLADAISSIDQGVGEFQKGLEELETGLGELRNGSKNFNSGILRVSQSSNDLTKASTKIKNALELIDQSFSDESDMPDLAGLSQLRTGLQGMKEGLSSGQENLIPLKENYDRSLDALSSSIETIPKDTIQQEEIEGLLESNANPEVIQQLIKSYEAAKRVQYIYEEAKAVFHAVPDALEQMDTSMNKVTDALEEMIKGLENLDNKSMMDDLEKLQKGIHELALNYSSFHNGLTDYTNGIDALASSYGEIDDGIDQFQNGISQLSKGATELKEGTDELANETNDMPNEMEEEIEKMLEEFDFSDYEPVSFVSDKNEKLRTVQFVMKTEELILEEEEEKEEVKKESKSFWEKFLDLFRFKRKN